MLRPHLSVLPLAALAISLAACGQAASDSSGANPAPTASTAVNAAMNIDVISDPATIGAYMPVSATAHVGDVVQWTFVDKNPHSVSSDDGSTFDSMPLAGGKKFQRRFDKAGTYAYHCSIHPEMHASLVVS